MSDLPTARTMLPQDSWLCLLVWCKACHHQAPADLQAIIDAGSSALTDFVVMSRDALGVQPWRADGADPTGAAGHLRGQRSWQA